MAELKLIIHLDDTENIIKASKIIINGETTVMITPEGKKIISRPGKNESYDKETGIAMCVAKYLFGSRRKFLEFVESAKDQTPMFVRR